MVRHQAPGPDLDPALAAPLGHQGEIGPVVVVAEEGLLATITPLGDVMGDAGGYDAGDTGHWGKIAEREWVSYTVPGINLVGEAPTEPYQKEQATFGRRSPALFRVIKFPGRSPECGTERLDPRASLTNSFFYD